MAALLIAKASLASERGVELRLLPESRVGKVYGALSRDLTTVVGNLVDNALDAAARPRRATGPRVEVLLVERRRRRRRHGDATAGPGVPDAERGLPAGLVHQERPGEDGGRGFGLALTRLVCRRRGGDVTVQQRRRRRVHRHPARRAAPAASSRRSHGVIEVLVVDDDFMVARIHTGFVERTPGFTVTGVAHTGAEALAEAERLQPDLVLLDVYLPDVSGLDLLGDLREAAPEVDVLVISAAREADTVRRALRGGIVHYLMKPFSYDDLRVRLEHYQQAYAAMAGEHTDQADVDRVFGVARRRQAGCPRGSAPRPCGWSRTRCAQRTPPTATSPPPRRPACSGISRVSARRYLEHLAETGQGRGHACATARSAGPSAATPGGEPQRSFESWAASSTVSSAVGATSSRASGIGSPLSTETPKVPSSRRCSARSIAARRSRRLLSTASSTPSDSSGWAVVAVVAALALVLAVLAARAGDVGEQRLDLLTLGGSSRARARVSSMGGPFLRGAGWGGREWGRRGGPTPPSYADGAPKSNRRSCRAPAYGPG